ncbi:MAG: DUF11 domain-containing protein, partial [Caldilineaceae bacterium]|nr:DUF11 domain-containing protein [Caldilineaceae bacterium]
MSTTPAPAKPIRFDRNLRLLQLLPPLVALLVGVLWLHPAYAQALDWATQAGGTSRDLGYGIAVDGAGNSYVTGHFAGTATFEATTLTSTGGDDVFVAKYDNAGTLVWVAQDGGTGFVIGRSIAVDSAGNSYVAGDFFGTATFGAGESNETTLTSAGADDIFIAKFEQADLYVEKFCYPAGADFFGFYFGEAGELPTTVNAGEQWQCTVVVINEGNGDAYDVRLVDGITPPTGDWNGGVTLETVVANAPPYYQMDNIPTVTCEEDFPYTMSDGPISCEVDTIPAGELVLVTYSFTVSPFYLADFLDFVGDLTLSQAPICNEVSVGLRTAADCDIVTDLADLRVSKIANTDMARPGEPLEYWIVVENWGPSAARGVAVRDVIYDFLDIPPGVDGPTIESVARPAQCGFEPDTDYGFCILGTPLEPMGEFFIGGTWHIKVESPQGAHQETTVTNKVDVFTVSLEITDTPFSGTPDPDISNNSATTVTVVEAMSDLGIEKEDLAEDGSEPSGEDEFRAGTRFRYGIEVTNGGPSIATNVVVQDPVPAGLTVVELGGLSGSQDCDVRESFGNTLVTCNLGTLQVDESRDFYIIVEIDPRLQDGAVLINTACTSSDNFDPDNADDCEEEETNVSVRSRIELEKSVSPADRTVYAGEEINYNLYVYNDGPSAVRDLVIKDDFAADFDDFVDLVSVNVAGGAGTCYFEKFGRRSLICTIGHMDPGEERRIDFVVKTDPSTPDDAVIMNDVYVASAGSPITDEPYDEAEVRVETHAALKATKRSSALRPATGDVFFYTVEVTNIGPSTAYSVTVDDELTGSVLFLYSRGAQCDAVGVDVTCALGAILPGETVAFDIVVQVKDWVRDGHRSDNVAVVKAAPPPHDTEPYLAYSEEIVFRNVHDLRIRKFGKPDGSAAAGEALVYTIIVDNFGPGRAWNVEVSDIIASDGSYTIAAPAELCPGVPAQGDGNTRFTCRIDGDPKQNYLEPGDQWVFNVTVTAKDAQSINNVADVKADGTDLNNDNNSAIVEHGVDAAVNLDVRKAVDHATVDAGGQLAYTIVVTNKGPSVATNVQVRDSLPAWVTLESITTNRGTCTPDDVSCVISTLNVNQSSTIQILVNVDADAPAGAHLDNTVRVASDEY